MEQVDTHDPVPDVAADRAVERTVHWATTPDEQEIALTRVRDEHATAAGVPAILVHGTYTNRRFWITEDGFGLGPFLARRGLDVWIPELRGHGRSPKGSGFRHVTAEDHIRLDLPTVHRHVTEQAGASPVLVGHSAGGLYLLGALSRGWIEPDAVQALAVFGTQTTHGEEYLNNRLVAGLLKGLIGLLGRFPAPMLGMGPEVEPAGEMIELIEWKATGRWTDPSGVSYREGLADLAMPFRAYAGADDETDPPEGCRKLFEQVGSGQRSYQLLSTEEGFSRDYGHAEMIASKAASREVWPDLADWIDQQLDGRSR